MIRKDYSLIPHESKYIFFLGVCELLTFWCVLLDFNTILFEFCECIIWKDTVCVLARTVAIAGTFYEPF